MPKYLTQADIETAIPAQTLVQLTDDNGDGVADLNVVSAIIEDAEAELDGFLVGQYSGIGGTFTNIPSNDRLLRLCAKDLALSFLFRRHPEYVRTFGESGRSDTLYKRAIERLNRLQNAEQQLPDLVGDEGTNPKNVGGVIFDYGHRIFTDEPGGTSNSGDF